MGDLDHAILPEVEIRSLIVKYRNGDISAADKIITNNARLIHRIAQRFLSSRVCGDTSLDDLMQYGRMGLYRAIQDFDLDRGVKFSTYAYYWVYSAVNRNGKQAGQSVSMSFGATEKRGKIGKARAKFEQQNGREPSRSELSAATGIEIPKMESLRFSVLSLDSEAVNESNCSFADLIIDESVNVEKDILDAIDKENIMKAVDQLPPTWRKLIVMRFGLENNREHTRREVGQVMGLTISRIQQIEVEALNKLRRIIENSGEFWGLEMLIDQEPLERDENNLDAS